MKPPTRPAISFTVFYLNGTKGWTPTNLGRFTTEDLAKLAAKDWATGYATIHGGTRPPVKVVGSPV
ncbi:MAG: hypothetical protein WC718_00405 [Phycisphaerales bacterium]|jgi:hypothetical protein